MQKLLLIGICSVFLVACNSETKNINNSKETTENVEVENDVLPSITREIVKCGNS